MSKKIARSKPFLVMRFGGMGDIMFCTPVIKRLARMGYDVHVATNEMSLPLLENNPHIAKSWVQPREGIVGMIDGQYPADLTECDGFKIPTLGLYDKYSAPGEVYPLNVANYYRVIENNSLHPMLWPTLGADFINTYDTHFSWAHIDPMSVPAHERRPMYYPTKAELAWGKEVFKDFPGPIVMIQPYASSPVRTFYRLTEVLAILKKRQNVTVVLWEPSQTNPLSGIWRILFSVNNGVASDVNRVIPWPESIKAPIRATAALIANAGLLVSADTCVSHLAEALKTFHLTYYTSVAAWTRSRDYEYEFTLDSTTTRGKDSDAVCKCGIIGRDCPRLLMDAIRKLNERERGILSLLNQHEREEKGIPPIQPVDLKGKQPHEFYETTPQALHEELKGVVARFESLRQSEALCAKSLDVAGYLNTVLDSARFNERGEQ